jgi:hypothetical protein
MLYFRDILAKPSRGAKQHPSNSAHLMRRFVRGLSMHVYHLFTPSDLQAQFPTRATFGAGVCGWHKHIPKHSKHHRNVMRPEWPNWTSPLAKANRPLSFLACIVYATLHHVGFYSLIFQIHHPCMRRELLCMLHSHTRKPNLAYRTRHPSLHTPFQQVQNNKISWLGEQYVASYGRLSNARAMPKVTCVV